MAMHVLSVDGDHKAPHMAKSGLIDEEECDCVHTQVHIVTAGRLEPPVEFSQRSPSPRGHSRASTMTSTLSFYAPSTLGSSGEPASRPSSQHLRQASEPGLVEKRSNSAKTLLSRGSQILKRQGSKFSLSSTQSSDGVPIDTASIQPHAFPKASNRRTRKSSLIATKRDILKRTISEPFGFQHITHTNRAHFENLGHVNRNELISEFSAIRAGQKAKGELRGIQAKDLATSQDAAEASHSYETALRSPTTDIVLSLPLTPPRPVVPPKDAETSSRPQVDIRMSRSVENFSRPSPRSPVSPATPRRRTSNLPAWSPSRYADGSKSPSSTSHAQYSPIRTTLDALDRADMPDKPLPELPPVHAVSTVDDTARPLRVGPLPKIPVDLADVPEEDESGSWENVTLSNGVTKQYLRHAQTLPNLKGVGVFDHATMDRTQLPSTEQSTSWARVDNQAMLPVGSSESKLGQKRVSVKTRAVPDRDWEDAIDDFWDQDADVTMGMDMHISTLVPPDSASPSPTRELQYATYAQPTPASNNAISAPKTQDRPSSSYSLSDSASTPELGLMMQYPASGLPLQPADAPTVRPTSSAQDHLCLQGLGIQQSRDVGEASLAQAMGQGDSSQTVFQPRLSQHGSQKSTMSKSSSQESIILSIASSILSGQRSSNSTASMTDLTPSMTSIRETTFESQPQTPKEEMPESWIDGFHSTLEILTDPGPPRAERCAQDFELFAPTYQKKPHRRAKSLVTNTVALSLPELAKTSAPNSPNPVSHSRKSSGSRIPVPARTSSITQTSEVKRPSLPRRQRSATTPITVAASKHRSRASYSLFPGAVCSMAS